MKNICPKCNEQQYSVMDCNYLRLYRNCWSCDHKKWQKNELNIKEFERREKTAIGVQTMFRSNNRRC